MREHDLSKSSIVDKLNRVIQSQADTEFIAEKNSDRINRLDSQVLTTDVESRRIQHTKWYDSEEGMRETDLYNAALQGIAGGRDIPPHEAACTHPQSQPLAGFGAVKDNTPRVKYSKEMKKAATVMLAGLEEPDNSSKTEANCRTTSADDDPALKPKSHTSRRNFLGRSC
jgi:hypothetical protein